ncbi:sporulation histidine kinase inhibitor Sda [Neobacillus niacini]
MQILSIEHLYEVLNRAVELNLPKEFIELVVNEINNKHTIIAN